MIGQNLVTYNFKNGASAVIRCMTVVVKKSTASIVSTLLGYITGLESEQRALTGCNVCPDIVQESRASEYHRYGDFSEAEVHFIDSAGKPPHPF